MKKSGINLHLSNRWLYSLITLTLILIVSVSVYAFTGPNGVGHTANEIENLPTSKLTGTISTNQIADNSITSAKIGDNQIVTAKIADSSLTDAKIQNINWSKISNRPAGLDNGDDVGGGLASCRVRLDQSGGSTAPSPDEGYSGYSSGNSELCTPFTVVEGGCVAHSGCTYTTIRICIQCQ